MLKSDQINELASALAKAQAEMKPAAFDSTNPHFKSKYASLASVWEACKGPLSKNGLSVSQGLNEAGMLETILMHTSGQYLISAMRVSSEKQTMQSMGSALTYAKRYSLSAMVGIVSDEDDDANSADAPRVVAAPRKQAPPQHIQPEEIFEEPPFDVEPPGPPVEAPKSTENTITDAQAKRLFAIAKKHHWTDDGIKSAIKQAFGIDSTRKIPWVKYNQLCQYIEMGLGPDQVAERFLMQGIP